MAWTTTIVGIVRSLINDLDASAYTWTDAQIQKFITISLSIVDAQLLQWTSITLGPYTVNFDTPSITPDPTTNGAPAAFVTLIALGAAKVAVGAEFKQLSLRAGFKITDDRSTIDGSNAISSLKQVSEDMSLAFNNALLAFQNGNQTLAQAILSPYSSPNYYPGGFSWFEGGESCR